MKTLTVDELNELLKRQDADLERQVLGRRVEENRKKLRSDTDDKEREKNDVKKEAKREHGSAFGRGSNSNTSTRHRIETIDLAEDEVKKEVKKEIKRERDSAFGESSNVSSSERRRIETIDLTDD